MESISKSALVSYTAEQMYELVNNVRAYPLFLPWCSDSVVHEETPEKMKASVSLAVGAVKQTFTTENRLEPGRRIDVRLVSGPFRHLQGFWAFEPQGEGQCRVSFQMEFEYRNRIIKMALNKIFTRIGETLVESFIERARGLYGDGQKAD